MNFASCESQQVEAGPGEIHARAHATDPRRLPVKKVTGPADFEYTSDGRSATAHKVFTAAVAEVAHGQAPTAVMVHVTANTWFTWA